tara:strand:- start:42 stop:533 length:492 start_codon:yes stop_codon:yes gene_type:complete
MAQLGIRDKDYRPNQYINPMLISGGREPNMESAPYRIFDKTNPQHPDYEGDEDEGDVQLELPLAHKRKDHDHKPDFQLPDGRDYYQSPNHEMMIPVDPSGNPIPELMNEEMLISQGGFVKNMGEPIDSRDFVKGLKIIDQEPNPLLKQLRLMRFMKSSPLKGV